MKFIACFDGCGFGCVGGGVACNCGFANGDEKFDKVWRFNGERCALEELHGDVHVLFDKVECVFHLAVVERNLFVSVCVHEIIEFSVVVEIFHCLGLDVSKFKFFGGVERLFKHCAGDDVFHLHTDERCALARFDVQEIDDGHNLVVIKESYALSQIACHNLCHSCILLNMFS